MKDAFGSVHWDAKPLVNRVHRQSHARVLDDPIDHPLHIARDGYVPSLPIGLPPSHYKASLCENSKNVTEPGSEPSAVVESRTPELSSRIVEAPLIKAARRERLNPPT